MTEVFFFQKVLTHYRVPLFRRLNQEYGWKIITAAEVPSDGGLNIVQDEPYLIPVPIQFFRNDSRYPMASLSLLDVLPKASSLISEFSLYFPAIYMFACARKIGRLRRLVFHTHGPNLTRDPESLIAHMSDSVRLRLFREADAIATYTAAGADWIQNVNPTIPTITIENTIDLSGPKSAAALVNEPKRLGSPQLLFCGRLTKERNATILLDVFDRLAARYPDARLVVIGSGQDAPALRSGWKARGEDERIVLLDGIYDERQLAPWFLGSDLFILPGPGGLSINHALAYGLPVIAFRSAPRGAFHGPEIAYVVDNETGLLVDRAAGADGLAAGVIDIVETPGRLEALKQKIPAFVEEKLQIEGMVRNFGAVNAILRS
jgi:glycosyltransferase involved in cell wall biosynthesis